MFNWAHLFELALHIVWCLIYLVKLIIICLSTALFQYQDRYRGIIEKGSDYLFVALLSTEHKHRIRYHPNPFREFPCRYSLLIDRRFSMKITLNDDSDLRCKRQLIKITFLEAPLGVDSPSQFRAKSAHLVTLET